MGKEIERKYLIKTDNYRSCSSKKYYKQGYLSTSEERVVRIRIIEEKGFITIKGKNKGATLPCRGAHPHKRAKQRFRYGRHQSRRGKSHRRGHFI